MNKRMMLALFLLSLCIIFFIAGSFAVICLAREGESMELGETGARNYLAEYISGELENYVPPTGYVPDSETAISIAVAIWKPIYGAKEIDDEAPYFAYQIDDYWVVTGSLPEGWLGGTAMAIIKKATGEVVHIIHEE